MAKTIVGLFDTNQEAQHVVRHLVEHGFSRNDISIIANDAAERGTLDNDYSETTAGTGTDAAKGAGTGAVVGGVAGLLVGLGALAIPGIGPVLAAGPLAAALAGVGIGAAAGGLMGALVHQGVPKEDAQFYAEGVRRGGTLVTVSAPEDKAQEAVDIFHNHHAVDIDRRADRYRQTGYTGYDENATPYTTDQIDREYAQYRTPVAADTTTNLREDTLSTGDNLTVPIVEEEIQVGKRQVQHGGVRVYSHITEQPIQESVQLHEEHVTVDRRPVDRSATDADFNAFKEGTLEITETAEEAVVTKQARVVEEVVINKNAQDRTEVVHDTVRRTNVDVQELNAGTSLDEDRTLNNETVTTRSDR